MEGFPNQNNSELVGIFGNFINRVAVLIHKYYDGVIPTGNENAEELSEISKLQKEINEYPKSKYEFRNALFSFNEFSTFWKSIFTNRRTFENHQRQS